MQTADPMRRPFPGHGTGVVLNSLLVKELMIRRLRCRRARLRGHGGLRFGLALLVAGPVTREDAPDLGRVRAREGTCRVLIFSAWAPSSFTYAQRDFSDWSLLRPQLPLLHRARYRACAASPSPSPL